MTSMTTIRTTGTLAATAAASSTTIQSGAWRLTPRRPSAAVVKHLRRIVATLVGLCAVVALPGTALAYTEPIGPDSGSVPNVGPAPYQGSASHSSAAGWGVTTVVGAIVISILAVGLLVVAQRVARHRHEAHPTALDA